MRVTRPLPLSVNPGAGLKPGLPSTTCREEVVGDDVPVRENNSRLVSCAYHNGRAVYALTRAAHARGAGANRTGSQVL